MLHSDRKTLRWQTPRGTLLRISLSMTAMKDPARTISRLISPDRDIIQGLKREKGSERGGGGRQEWKSPSQVVLRDRTINTFQNELSYSQWQRACTISYVKTSIPF